MDWKEIPSLAALRAFEAAARNASLSAAARELNVTHAAIAQHITGLSAHFGEALLQRQGNRMVTTPTGQILAQGLSAGFGQIAETVHMINQTKSNAPLKITTTANFADFWLMPRLPGFWRDHPDVPLSIEVTNTVVDLRHSTADLAIRFGQGNWPGVDSKQVFPVVLTICAAPTMLQAHPEMVSGDFSQVEWVLEDNFAEGENWLKDNGMIGADSMVRRVPTQGSARALVKAGAAASILFDGMIEEELSSGSVVALGKSRIGRFGYYTVTRKGTVSKQREIFVKWLTKLAKSANAPNQFHKGTGL
ncbi:hypothetical protein BFP70_12315 [Thioclava sp. SK-1]|uniref:LysR family transcriptional regulator n=1 Tax=Thioclava sp. SK-1 TaxID=1889770 RepID=UPI000824ECAF|nr:LysR family transcriptional regulator [Thioclava sp. SK-1]OCX63428.1 hypothetical protein BFP70_12315 [Thioclava sp. SK-1]